MESIDGRDIGSYIGGFTAIGGLGMGWKKYQESRGLTFMGKEISGSSPSPPASSLTKPIVKINSNSGMIQSSIRESIKKQEFRTRLDRIGTMADTAVSFMEGRLTNPAEIQAASAFREEALFALQRTLTDPMLQGKLGDINPHEVMSRAIGSSIDGLSAEYKNLLSRGDEVSRVLKKNISEELVTSFADEKISSLKERRGRSFYDQAQTRTPLSPFDTMNLQRQQVDFEAGLSRAKKLPGFEGLRKFVTAANEARVKRGSKASLSLERPTSRVNFIESRIAGSNFLYAEVDVGAGLGKVMFPLERPTVETMGQKLPLYLSSRHATGAVSYIGNYLQVERTGVATQGEYAGVIKSNRINEAERIFWGTDSKEAMIIEALRDPKQEGSIESRMISKFRDADLRANPHQYGHHVPFTPGGLASAAVRHSMAALESSDPTLLENHHEAVVRSLMASDNNVRPIGSPGQIGQKGMVYLDSNTGPLNMFDPELKDAFSGARRPLQALSEPYHMMNAGDLTEFALRDSGDVLYSPVKSPMLNRNYYKEMMNQGIAAFTTPRIFSIRESAHNIVGEGQLLYDEKQLLRTMGGSLDEITDNVSAREALNRRLPKYLAPAGTFSVAIGEDGLLSSSLDPRIRKLMEIANQVEGGDPVAQRNALIKASIDRPSLQFSKGEVIGQSIIGERGAADVKLNVGEGFRGKLIPTSVSVQDGMVRIGFGGQIDGIEGLKTFLNKEVGQSITPEQMANIERQLGITSESFRGVGLYARGGELLKEGQLAHVRTQQVTASKRLLASRLGMVKEGVYTTEGRVNVSPTITRRKEILKNFLDSDESTSLERIRSLGGQRREGPSLASLISKRTGISEEVLRRRYLTDELEGTLRGVHAFEKTFRNGRFTSAELGMVFGVEGPAGKEGLINFYRNALGDQAEAALREDLSKVLGARSDDFVNRVIIGASQATAVYGEAPAFARDMVGAYKYSPQSIERRAIETLTAMDEWQLGEHSNTKILLNAIRKGSTVLDERELGALKRLNTGLESLKTMDFDSSVGVERLTTDQAGTARISELIKADTRGAVALEVGDTRTFIPATDDLNILRSPIGVGEDSYLAGEIERKASVVLRRAHDVGLDPENQQTLEEFKKARSEYQDQITRARALPYLRSINPTLESAIYETVTASGREFSPYASDLISKGTLSLQDSTGVTARVSPSVFNQMLSRLEISASSEEDIGTINKYRHAALTEGKAVPFMFSRSPADSPGAVQMGSVIVDPKAQGIQWNQARLTIGQNFLNFKAGEVLDVTPVRAAALSADLDGDRVLASLLLTGNVKLDDELISNARVIAERNLGHQAQRIVGMEFFDRQFKSIAGQAAQGPELSMSQINEEMARIRSGEWLKLRQSRSIGLLAFNLGQVDSIAKEAMVRGDLTSKQFNAIAAMNYTMLQQAVSFKHGTGGLADEITREVGRILNHSSDVGADLADFYKKRFGDLSRYADELGTYGLDTNVDYGKLGASVAQLRKQGFGDAWNNLFKMSQKNVSDLTESDWEKALAASTEVDMMHSRLLMESLEAQGADYSRIKEIVDRARTDANLSGGAIKTGVGGNWRAAAPWAMGGLMLGSMIHGLTNVGYSGSALDAPPTPDGRPGMTNMAVRMAIADGSLLDNTGSTTRHMNRNQIPEQQPTYTGNNMPIRGTINNNVHIQQQPVGNIAMNTQVHSQEGANQLIHALHSRIPHGQIGVNVSHRSYVPHDMQQLL